MNAVTMNTTRRIPVIQTGHASNPFATLVTVCPPRLARLSITASRPNANEIRIRLDESHATGKKHVHRIAIVDDGSGMDSDLLHHYS